MPDHNGLDLAAEVSVLKVSSRGCFASSKATPSAPRQFQSFAGPSAFLAAIFTNCRSKTAGPGLCTTLTVACGLVPKPVATGGGNASTRQLKPKTSQSWKRSCSIRRRSGIPSARSTKRSSRESTRWPPSVIADRARTPISRGARQARLRQQREMDQVRVRSRARPHDRRAGRTQAASAAWSTASQDHHMIHRRAPTFERSIGESYA
jgi:hypothetical protein